MLKISRLKKLMAHRIVSHNYVFANLINITLNELRNYASYGMQHDSFLLISSKLKMGKIRPSIVLQKIHLKFLLFFGRSFKMPSNKNITN